MVDDIMQTFLPYADFEKTARCLDYRRLGKQRVENMQIMNALCGISSGWSNHPATLMWEGHEKALMKYQEVIVEEWVERGYTDNVCLEKTRIAFDHLDGSFVDPWWLGNAELHNSHKSNLLRKDLEWYSQFGWSVKNDLEYWWPTKQGLKREIEPLMITTSV
jgi:hypothetical protein